MRPFKPAPKNAAANRIRERYLHQLGLQRGGMAPLTAPHLSANNSHHVVVISGLPSLPEDRPTTTEHVMESHDFSISKHSQHTGHTGVSPGSGDANSLGDDTESDSGSVTHSISSRVSYMESIPCSGDNHSHCSKSTLSVSPNTTRESSETLTSMALSYPKALLTIPPPAKPTPPPNNNNTLPFSLSHSVPWRSTSLSKPASVLLDLAEYHHGENDHDSVSSAGTSTTAESSLTAAMVSRDWGAMPQSTSGVSTSSQGGESPASTPGVYFQCGHPRLLGGNATVHCATTSSLSHALNRFNIDSDCEASVASNSIVEDHIMDEDDASFDDTASRTSVTSHTSAGSTKSQLSASVTHGIRGRKKIGKKQRLMERAVAHERILQIRNDHSLKMRANLVHSQRMGNVSISGLSSAMAQETRLSESPCSATSSSGGQASIPLVHVQHSRPGHETNCLPLQSTSALGRTPTSSNCSDLRRLTALGAPCQYLSSLPVGVHISDVMQETVQTSQGSNGGSVRKTAPLGFHPQLASCIPIPPPKLGGMMLPNRSTAHIISNSVSQSFSESESRKVENSTSLQHMNHPATVDDVMEVAMTLSKLGGGRPAFIPRIR